MWYKLNNRHTLLSKIKKLWEVGRIPACFQNYSWVVEMFHWFDIIYTVSIVMSV